MRVSDNASFQVIVTSTLILKTRLASSSYMYKATLLSVGCLYAKEKKLWICLPAQKVS